MRFFDITSEIEKACLHDSIEFLEVYVLHGKLTSEVMRKARAVSAYAGGFVKNSYLKKMVSLSMKIVKRPSLRLRFLSVAEARSLLMVLKSVGV